MLYLFTDTKIDLEAMAKLEDKFKRKMQEVAELSDEKQRLEHLVLQLQGETETIGQFLNLFKLITQFNNICELITQVTLTSKLLNFICINFYYFKMNDNSTIYLCVYIYISIY